MTSSSIPQSHFHKLENMYRSARINESIPSAISVSEGTAEVKMKVSQAFWHGANAMHGSMYFKGLDDAAFFAANSVVEGFFVLTARFEIELLSMVKCENLRAVDFLEKRESRKIWARAELYDDQNTLAARGSGLFLISQIVLCDSVGYTEASLPTA